MYMSLAFRLCYVVQALKSSYAHVITTEPFETLTTLLGSKSPERYTLAAKFITTCNLESKEVGMSAYSEDLLSCDCVLCR